LSLAAILKLNEGWMGMITARELDAIMTYVLSFITVGVRQAKLVGEQTLSEVRRVMKMEFSRNPWIDGYNASASNHP
jgi:hypothetical protein